MLCNCLIISSIGRDDGCVGQAGTKESVVNLKIAKKLQKNLENLNFNVIMTRMDLNGLYDSNAKNFKKSDMNKRVEIINKSSPNMVISIHQNSYSDRTLSGAQVFYKKGEDESKNFALCMQNQLISVLPNARKNCSVGDYFIFNECNVPTIIVECGYLTNLQEEKMLSTDSYQEKVAYAIMCGVVKYYSF